VAWSLPEGAVLGVFAKRPDPGQVKTRLATALGDDFAAKVAEAMTLDIADLWGSDRILAEGGRRVLAFTPDDAGPWFDARVGDAWSLVPQVGEDLGTRMRSFFADEFEDGATRVVLIGADSPTIDPSIIVSAFLTLEHRDVVIGPSSDGGYYLIGCRVSVPPIFDGINWSTPDVLSQTIDAIRDTGRSLGVLPPWYDVDTPDDWRTLRGHVRALRRAGVDPGLPRVETLARDGG